MSWLRIDDKLARHPKILKLPRADRWTWVELLCYCAEYRTDGYIPPTIGDVLRYVTPSFLKKAVAAGLVDEQDNGPIVHDWGDYNGRDPKILQAERKRQQRDRAVTSAGTGAVTQTGPQAGQTTGHGRVENVTRAQARARAPHPQPQELNPPTLPVARPDEPAGGRQDLNEWGRTPDEQARIDHVDALLERDEPGDRPARDAYIETFDDLAPLGEHLTEAMRGRDER